MYDTIILCGIWVFSIVVIVTAIGGPFTGAWAQTLCFVEAFAFYCFFWMHKGQTIGMLAWRLRLDTDGVFTLRKALLRFCGELLSIASVGLGYFWIWIDKDRRSWSDILSGSCVVRYRKR
ncbi:MAG: RDD family protein [Gammaproteobacteria bacterium]|nr:RDD family protein [Gammaproteobacteria bacterium]MYF37145.1 RDD family protein [Gammaproteobacteria bacterium]